MDKGVQAASTSFDPIGATPYPVMTLDELNGTLRAVLTTLRAR